jgi:hypothetical protein
MIFIGGCKLFEEELRGSEAASAQTNASASEPGYLILRRLLKNTHLRRFPHPSALRRTSK